MPGSASSSTPSKSSDSRQYVFLAGAISGVAEGVTIQPLEMLKTRFQINQGAHLRIIPTVKGAHEEDNWSGSEHQQQQGTHL
jgi:solute carrier family 25 2-oxodicarboxylate transporter 21